MEHTVKSTHWAPFITQMTVLPKWQMTLLSLLPLLSPSFWPRRKACSECCCSSQAEHITSATLTTRVGICCWPLPWDDCTHMLSSLHLWRDLIMTMPSPYISYIKAIFLLAHRSIIDAITLFAAQIKYLNEHKSWHEYKGTFTSFWPLWCLQET